LAQNITGAAKENPSSIVKDITRGLHKSAVMGVGDVKKVMREDAQNLIGLQLRYARA
jgi:hypothetical protein